MNHSQFFFFASLILTLYWDRKISCLLNGAVKCSYFGFYKILGMACSNNEQNFDESNSIICKGI